MVIYTSRAYIIIYVKYSYKYINFRVEAKFYIFLFLLPHKFLVSNNNCGSDIHQRDKKKKGKYFNFAFLDIISKRAMYF